MDLWSIGQVLQPRVRMYLPVVPLAAAIAAAVGLYRVSRQPVRYVSESRMVVTGKMNISVASPFAEELGSFLGTQTSILQSEEVKLRASARLRAEHPELVGVPEVSVYVVPHTTIFAISASSANDALVQPYLNALMEEFIAFRRDRRVETSRSVIQSMGSEIERLEKQIARQQSELLAFKQKNNVGFWELQSTTAAQYLSQLKNREATLRMQLSLVDRMADRSVREAREDQLTAVGRLVAADAEPRPLLDAAGAAGIAAARQRLIQLQVEREALARTFLPAHPKLKKVDAELANQRRLLALLDTESETAFTEHVGRLRSELETLSAAITEWEAKAIEASRIEAEYQKLKADLTRSEELYQRLVASVQSIDVEKGMEPELLQVLQYATKPAEVRPSLRDALGRSLFAGFAIGALILVACLRLDRRAFAAEELVQELGHDAATVELPKLRRAVRVNALSPAFPLPLLEGLRQLRSTLALETRGAEARVVMVASSIPGEGKSTVAANLAIVCAQAGIRTLLVDADLRKGGVHDAFSAPADQPGLVDVIRGGRAWRDCVQQPAANLDVLFSGAVSADAADLLSSGGTSRVIAEARREYQLVVIDAAPVLPVSDSLALLPAVDAVYFLTRIGRTPLPLARKALARIRRQHPRDLTLVVNAVSSELGEYGYAYTKPARSAA